MMVLDEAPPSQQHSQTREAIELSVVIPCLNEADTIGVCLTKALRSIGEAGIQAEVIVADNGSTDGSIEIAARLGARVVPVKKKGYGNALMGGIEAARGEYIIMGDADDSYDFLDVPRFVQKLREGFDLVQGCRLPAGGGKVLPGAMPFLHRWWGNPMFTVLSRWWFRSPVHDIYSGFRGFTKALYYRLQQRCTGMEFATEMIIKASLYRAKIAEIPITLHRDGRKSHAPHLKTFRDGWRTLRFFMLFSPRWLFLMPGLAMSALGLLGYALALPGVTIGRITFDAHTLLFASMGIMCGYEAIVFALFTRTYGVAEGLMPEDPRLTKFFKIVTLERGLIGAAIAIFLGLTLLGLAVNQWRLAHFGRLDYAHTMRYVIPGATLTTIGLQTFFSSFFLSIMGMRRQ
ncbi:MAG TPA: glycosyltransferase family 2 protein [Verrucomicrobiae bacterium]|jgi:glycosyltransferase involved in cell wall biosynthesis|nr:glycosyltransferase family 2 protein [Verrucomicrobiae bacterium]